MILAEAALMGLIGGLLGLGIGMTLSRIFFISMNSMSGYNLDYLLPSGAIVAGLVVSLVISQFAAIFPARRAATIRILDAIHYE
jgi:putative ABC transport system permease protein